MIHYLSPVSTRRGAIEYYGKDNQSLDDLWNPDPVAYLSIFPPDMPNFFIYFGPNGGPLTGSTIHMLEWSCNYMSQTVKKVQREYIKSITAK